MITSGSTIIENGAHKKRVLIVAYAFSPILGSEYRSAWELVGQISKYHDVTVLFGDSDGLMGSFEHFDNYAKENHLHFRAIKVNATARQVCLAKRMRTLPWSLAFPALLRTWHMRAFEIAMRLHCDKPFDVAHQLGPIGFRNPGYLWKLDCHTYWGPIGGAQYINIKMVKNKLNFYFLEAIIRNVSVWLLSQSPYIKKAALGYDRVSFATVENSLYFAKNYQRSGPIVSDQGLYEQNATALSKGFNKFIRVTWAGSLTPRKNIDALIDVIKKSPTNVLFNILGGGSRAADVRALAAQFQNVNYLGLIPRTEVMNTLAESDVILLTSLSEANTAILFEAVENNCIPIVPRINGFVSVLNDDVAYLIDQHDYASAISQIVAALVELTDQNTRIEVRAKLQAHKCNLTWSVLVKEHLSQYE